MFTVIFCESVLTCSTAAQSEWCEMIENLLYLQMNTRGSFSGENKCRNAMGTALQLRTKQNKNKSFSMGQAAHRHSLYFFNPLKLLPFHTFQQSLVRCVDLLSKEVIKKEKKLYCPSTTPCSLPHRISSSSSNVKQPMSCGFL